MAKEPLKPEKSSSSNDDELLANAIPIDDLEVPAAKEAADDIPDTIDLAEGDTESSPKEIRSFSKVKLHQDVWNRKPNANGQGAIHVKTFVSKLRLDAIDNLDQQINEWLDSHPEYEVKFTTSCIGALTGKLTEPALFVMVWV